MGERDRVYTIWQPAVEATVNCVPHPSVSAQQANSTQQIYTKTSLRASGHEILQNQCERKNAKSLNRDIVSADHSHNNTPKPFVRDQQTIRQGSVNQQSTSPLIGQSEHKKTSTESMAPKLVHNQYNSPIDLYSMNNIRRAIEAHTELIAPGVKGINFMKSDMPINKQSEVYKLVMEEKQQKQRQLSPISGQPVDSSPNAPSCASGETRQHQQSVSKVSHELQHLRTDYYPRAAAPQQLASGGHEQNQVRNQERAGGHSPRPQQQQQYREAAAANNQASPPRCSECGQYIVGAMAKVQNRFIHPQCFNCTTCGTSLKNTGYFTVNEKLYCDIHAKQVANLMRINHNFASSMGTVSEQHERATISATNVPTVNNLYSTASDFGQNEHLKAHTHNKQATISTMFAKCANTAASSSALGGLGTAGATQWRQSASGIGEKLVTTSESSRQTSSTWSSQQQTQQQQQVNSGANIVQGRAPVCVRCGTQIRGPYLLAGQTTWCKPCSRSNFVCNSCNCSLLEIGFIEDGSHRFYCERCFDEHYAPLCSRCNSKIRGDRLNALGKHWHPACFVCGHCARPFGNLSFYLEDNVPYCERDWNMLFTTKCSSCSCPISAGDKWIEALDKNYHSHCFTCTACQVKLEGSTFYCKNGKPYCKLHAK